MVTNRPFVSVIVPVYNGGTFLHRCLDALLANDFPQFEVIVVDDGSTDDSAAISKQKGVTVLATARARSGPAAARNLAAMKAKGDILLFVDADVVVEPDTITKVVESFEIDPAISAVFGSYDDRPAEENFLSQYKNLQHHFVHQNSSREASTFWAGLGAIRSITFAAVGGFDLEQFATPSIEDIELGFRLRQAGHRILLNKEIRAKHLKKWGIVSLLKTEIFSRALPWSRLILTSQGLINDMNLKTTDRISAVLVGLTVMLLPFAIWKPILLFVPVGMLMTVFFLNLKIFRFFANARGPVFAAMTFPWQLAYFFYSGATFVLCWFWYALPSSIGIVRSERARQTR